MGDHQGRSRCSDHVARGSSHRPERSRPISSVRRSRQRLLPVNFLCWGRLQDVVPFRNTGRLSDSDRVKLMGGTLKVYNWSGR